MKKGVITIKLSLIALLLLLLQSCDLFVRELPCFLRGKWVSYDSTLPDSNIITAIFEFDNKGNYRKTESNQSGTYIVVTNGKYGYSYNSFNYEECSGHITFTPDNLREFTEEEYIFYVKMNAENGLVSLDLTNTTIRKKYELDYAGSEEIYINDPEETEEEGAEEEGAEEDNE